jgi:hypothetical protein
MTMHVIYRVDETVSRLGASVVEGEEWRRTNGGAPGGNTKLLEAAVPCYPLSSLLTAGGLQRLDFLTLDLEGLELQALKTLNWDLHDIKVKC